MIDAAKLSRRLAWVASALLLAGCTPQDTAETDSSTLPSQQRSFLGTGPALATGPNYVRDSVSVGPRQTDAFGNGVLPRAP